MYYQTKLIVLFCFILCPFIGFSQNNTNERISIPIELYNNEHIFIKVRVNGGKELSFVFDTGATVSLIDKKSAEELNIISDYETNIQGGGGVVKYQAATNQELSFQNLKMDSVNLIFEDLTRLKKSFDGNLDGIVGYDIIKRYLTEIDIDNKMINLYPKNAKLNYSSHKKLPFTFENNIKIPHLKIDIELTNGEKLNGQVLFDNGAGDVLYVNTPFKEKHRLIEKSKKVLSGSSENLSKKSDNHTIALKRLNFAGYDFFEVPVMLSSDKEGVNSFEDYLGLLGNVIINRFNIILDYEGMNMYVKPNKLFDVEIDKNLTGFSLGRDDENNIYIRKISKESPAYEKGIREGDVIFSIDNKKSQNIGVYKNLLKQEGKQVDIEIKRDNKIKKVRLKLKNLL